MIEDKENDENTLFSTISHFMLPVQTIFCFKTEWRQWAQNEKNEEIHKNNYDDQLLWFFC